MNLKSLLAFIVGAFLGAFVVFGLMFNSSEPERVICIDQAQYNNSVVDQIIDVHHRLNLSAR